VTFNYRYSPRNSKVKEILQSGEIGEVLSIHFEWLLDTRHGADYFRRWHRDKNNSGGLMVHKSTHHFDLVNWWLGASPETVFAMGKLGFYGRANGEKRGLTEFPARYHGWAGAKSDPFAIHLAENPIHKALFLDAEKQDGYIRDQNVFGDNITIEDTMGVMVRYDNEALLTYSLNAHCPWEGYRVMFNGTRGRLEVEVVERSYVAGSKTDHNLAGQHALATDPSLDGEGEELESRMKRPVILLQHHWEKAREIPCEVQAGGGHGGGDIRLLDDIFRGGVEDPLDRAANYIDGARSILVGIAANRCFKTRTPVEVDELVRLPELESEPEPAGVV
jgi:predicted dehydrogenase